jgi:hypothetical protein
MSEQDNPSTAGAAKPVGSIEDYAQFHNLLGDWMRARDYWQDDAAAQVVEKWQKFIAYIDGCLAAPALNPSEVPAIVRDAIEATFEQRPGYMTKVGAAVRAIKAADQQGALGEKGDEA